jgi:hypothetical protein
METHPDILAMRNRHEVAERATTTPRAQAIETMALITGLYLAASPWIAGFNDLPTLAVNNLIVGIAYALLMSGGFGRAYERTHSMAWAACALGAWTIIAPWAVAGDVSTTRTVVNNVIVGIVALLLALAASAVSRPGRAPGGGGEEARPSGTYEDELRGMTVDELRDLARREGISGVHELRKEELVHAITATHRG